MAALALTMAEAPQRVAFAQGKLDARYVVTLSGLPIGRGAWVIDIGEDYFTAAASGATAGLLRVFANGEGESSARGTISGGQRRHSERIDGQSANRTRPGPRSPHRGAPTRGFGSNECFADEGPRQR